MGTTIKNNQQAFKICKAKLEACKLVHLNRCVCSTCNLFFFSYIYFCGHPDRKTDIMTETDRQTDIPKHEKLVKVK